MNTSPETLRLGLIGCGKVARQRHLPALARVPGIDVMAAADPDIQSLEALAEQYAIPHRYRRYQDLLEDPNVEAVGILTPTPTHMEIGLAALDADKHVLMEKPLALSVQECDRIIEKQKTTSKTVVLCFNLRWHRLVRQAREVLRSGQLGRIRAIRSVYTHFRQGHDAPDWHRVLARGGGVTFNESVHHFDLWRHLLGEDIVEVCAFHQPSEYYEDETSVISARLSDSILGSMFNTFKTSPTSELELYGEAGRLFLSLYRFDGLDYYPSDLYPGNIPNRLLKLFSSFRQLTSALPALRQGGDFDATFSGIWKHFAICVREGKTPESTLEDGKQAVHATLAAIESFTRHHPVSLQ